MQNIVTIQYKCIFVSNPEWIRRDCWDWKQCYVYLGWNSVVFD